MVPQNVLEVRRPNFLCGLATTGTLSDRVTSLSGSPLAWRLNRQIPSALVHHLVQLQTQVEGRKGANTVGL